MLLRLALALSVLGAIGPANGVVTAAGAGAAERQGAAVQSEAADPIFTGVAPPSVVKAATTEASHLGTPGSHLLQPAAESAHLHCWGGPSTCKDAWVPQGMSHNDMLASYRLYMVGASAVVLLLLLRVSYTLFVGWLYLGNVFCEFVVYVSLNTHILASSLNAVGQGVHGSATKGSQQQQQQQQQQQARLWAARSICVTRFQLIYTITHNAIFQTAVNTYLAVNWGKMSLFFASSFLAFNAVWLLEVCYCVHSTARCLKAKGVANSFEQFVFRVTRPISAVAACSCMAGRQRAPSAMQGVDVHVAV
uniref:Uncharacterized protein n=1 Tax=Tetradesmus obliquus TaxID=3088 RepID=A0A383VZ19_TETOB|eukprot:jgi/Sobl393_1/19747/SZX70024.1